MRILTAARQKGNENMNYVNREKEMDLIAGRLQRRCIKQDLPVQEVQYDVLEGGAEWLHVIGADEILHIDVSGLTPEQAMELGWEKIRTAYGKA